MQYKAEQRCFIDNILYEKGDIIESKKKLKASWLQPVQPVKQTRSVKKKAIEEPKSEGETITL